MIALLIFAAALAAIVLVAITVNRAGGVRAQYLETWAPVPGERRLHEDPVADFYVIPRMGQARFMSFARRGRTHAVLTDRRIVIGTRAFMSRRHMVTHMVHLAGTGAGPEELTRLTGGQFSVGFVVFSASPDLMTVEADGAKPYLRIVPEPTTSAVNVEHMRLYSDRATEFAGHARTA